MLVLTRKSGESVVLPTLGMKVTVLAVRNGTVKLGFAAPAEVRILRAELDVNQANLLNGCREPRELIHESR